MQCDRAQEYFSDYLERTLDRPMTVALESHLATCLTCREDIETLRDTFLALDAVPAVQPPADGAWQVMCRIRQARAEQLEAAGRRAPSFMDWLRSLSPARVAMGTGLGTFIVAGALAVSGIPHTILGFFGRGSTPTPIASDTRVGDKPAIGVSYGDVSAEGRQITVQVLPVVNMLDAYVQVAGANLPLDRAGQGDIWVAKPAELTFRLPASSSVEVLQVLVKSKSLTREYQYKVIAPATPSSAQNVTAIVPALPLETGLRQIVPYLGRPVVVDGGVDGNVSLQVENQPPLRTLEQVAGQVGARVSQEHGIYRLSPVR